MGLGLALLRYLLAAAMMWFAELASISAPPTPMPTPQPIPTVAEATYTATPAPVMVTPTPMPACTAVPQADATLAEATRRAVRLLEPSVGCPSWAGVSVVVAQFDGTWERVLSRVRLYSPTHKVVEVDATCLAVVPDWAPVIAHELGHTLGWLDLDGHPYMSVARQSGTSYRPGDLAVVC